MAESSVRSAADLSTPLLGAVNSLAKELLGIDLMIVYPTSSGWAESSPGAKHSTPDFCRLVQTSREGAKHCRMCHILMSVAADSSGLCEQRCHAGSSVLVAPIRTVSGEVHAILSSCIFGGTEAVATVRDRAKTLGIDADDLVAAFRRLPELPPEKRSLAKLIMDLAHEAGCELLTRLRLERRLEELSRHHDKPSTAVLALEQAISEMDVSLPPEGKGSAAERVGTPHTILLVSNLIAKRPYLPFSLNELAAASRLTRNHFSRLFHEHVGKTFSAYLTERRMMLAKELLRNPTLNISEVASRSGYDDPGYFARRFHQSTGMSPRQWRQDCVGCPTPPSEQEARQA